MKKWLSPTVIKKNITRFAPLWGLYTVFVLIYMFLMWDSCGSAARFVNQASLIMTGMSTVNMLYAGLCAMVLFGDLFNPKMCNMLHAMPLRREGWFGSHLISGLLFSVAPNTLGALIAAAFLGQYAYGAFLWLALMVLQYLLFFGIGVFAAMCAGNRLGTAAMYTMVNFFAALAAWLLQLFYEPLLYGVQIEFRFLSWLCPVVKLTDNAYIVTQYDKMGELTVLEKIPAEPWIYAGLAAAAGVALMVLALLIYRKRSLESAGNFISLKPMAPVFLILYTLCVGAVFFLISGEDYVLLLIGFAVGFFTGRMLLEKKAQVFRLKNLLTFGIFVAAFIGSVALTAWDPVGITTYVPEADRVKSVTLYPENAEYYRYRPDEKYVLTDPEDVDQIRKMHQELAENRDETAGNTLPITLVYQLENGRTVERSYRVSRYSSHMELLGSIYSRPEYLTGVENMDTLLDRLISLDYVEYTFEDAYHIYMGNQPGGAPDTSSYSKKVTFLERHFTGSFAQQAEAVDFMKAFYADCQRGTTYQWYNEQAVAGHLTLRVMENYEVREIRITVYETNINTVDFVQELKQDRQKQQNSSAQEDVGVCRHQYQLISKHTQGYLELEKVEDVPGYIDVSVKSVHIANQPADVLCEGVVEVAFLSSVDVVLELYVSTRQSRDNLGSASHQTVSLKAGVPQTVSESFKAWEHGNYRLRIRAKNGDLLCADMEVKM